MEILYRWSLQLSHWLQTTFPELEGFFYTVTDLGEPLTYILVLPFIYWSVNRQLGMYALYLVNLGNTINTMFKGILRGPRTWWLIGYDVCSQMFSDDFCASIADTKALDPDKDYGIPSGHAQLALTFYLLVAVLIQRGRRLWWVLIAIVLALIMGLSRIYLAAHQIQDVLFGYVLALLTLAGFFWWLRNRAPQFRQFSLNQQLLIVTAVPILLALIYGFFRILIGPADLTVPWSQFVPEAESKAMRAMASPVGSLLGLGIGFLLERRFVRFRADGPIWKRIARYILGMAVVLALIIGLDRVLPFSSMPLYLFWLVTLLQYAIVNFWAAFLAPLVFVRLNLAEVEMQPIE